MNGNETKEVDDLSITETVDLEVLDSKDRVAAVVSVVSVG